MCTERDGCLIGVLNDYDMAAVMAPGSRFPETDENNLAGTGPFVALDLIEYPVEGLRRWYRTIDSTWSPFARGPHLDDVRISAPMA